MRNPLLKFYILIEFLGHKQSFRNGSIEACNFFFFFLFPILLIYLLLQKQITRIVIGIRKKCLCLWLFRQIHYSYVTTIMFSGEASASTGVGNCNAKKLCTKVSQQEYNCGWLLWLLNCCWLQAILSGIVLTSL